jgi:hypothetical protein
MNVRRLFRYRRRAPAALARGMGALITALARASR